MTERAVRLALEHQGEYGSQYEAIRSVTGRVACDRDTLCGCGWQAEREVGRRPGLTTDERACFADLEREVKELHRANEILRQASANLAQP